jgi:hypothetical protein
MHLLESHNVDRLPKRFPVGTTYVVEGRGGEEGHLRVFSRYVVLPDGQRINLSGDLAADFGGPASPRASHRPLGRSRTRSESQAQNGEKRRSARAKKIMAGAGTTRRHAR